MLAAWTQVQAQCTQGAIYGSGVAATTCSTVTASPGCHYINEYAKFTGLTIGNTYQIGNNVPGLTSTSTTTAGAFITTLYDAAGTVLTSQTNMVNNLTSITFVATTTEVHVQTNTYTGSVCGTSGSFCNYYGLICASCTTGPGAPACPTLSSPAANATGVSVMPTLTWVASAGAASYEVYLDVDASCSITPTTLVATVNSPSYTVTTPLNQLTQYRWMVIPKDCAGAKPASCTPRCFTTAGPPPANDNCATATAFPTIPTDGTCATLSSQTTSAATNSNVTPTGSCTSNSGSPDDDVWFSFVAPATSLLLQATYVSGLTDIYMQVFSSACGSSMTSILCTDTDAGGTITGLTVGNTYYIRLYTYATTGFTVQTLCLKTPPPPPANDNCATATAFPTIPTDGTCATLSAQTTAGATNSGVTPTGSCTSNSGTPDDDVWFSFVAPATSLVLQWTYVSGLTDIFWQVFSSACASSMVATACSDVDAGATLTGLTVGNTYYIRLYTYASSGNTTQNACLKTLPAVPTCATLVSPANGATNVAINTPLTWTAPATGGAPSGYKVYLGTVNPPTTLVATVAAPATTYTPTGQVYNTTYYWYIVPTNAAGDAVGCNGTVFSYMTGAPPPPPANDLCSGATSITSGPGVFVSPGVQTTESATATGAPGTGGTCTTVSVTDYDVWYSFTTDADGGDITINVIPTTPQDIVVQGFTTAGSCTGASVCADLQVLAGPLTNGGEALTMTALSLHGGNSTENTATYFFRVYHYTGTATAPSPFMFTINATGTALPIELKSFTGRIVGSSNMLEWETLTEKNVQSHIVERSTDGIRWSEVGRVAGKSNSQASVTYSLLDNAPLARAYYRLRSVDIDGKENLSNSIVLTRKGDNFGITSVYPSPTVDKVTVQFTSTEEEKVTVRVMDMTGRLVLQQVVEAVKDINELPLTLNGLQSGVYSVTVSNSTAVSTPVRFVKQ